MSSVSKGAWRRPTYYVTTATPLLANEVVMADPHGPANHANRTFVELVPAGHFGRTPQAGFPEGILIYRNPTPFHRLTNATDVICSGVHRIPKGVVSLDNVQIVVTEPAGAVGAGDAFIGVAAVGFVSGDANVGLAATLEARAIPAESGANAILQVLSPTSVPSITLTSSFAAFVVQREANNVLDTFEDDLEFVGMLLTWTVDE